MADSKFVSSSLDREHYLKSFWVYNSLSERSKAWSTYIEDVLVGEFVAHFTFTMDKNEELRLLGIGSGSGEMESHMLPMLLRGYPRINNRVVEPAKDQMIKYKALAQSKGHELQGVKFDWRQQTLEQYRDTDGDGTKFHFISSIDSMYDVSNVDSSLMYMYDLLEPGGKLIVVISSENSGLWRIWDRFSRYQGKPTDFVTSSDVHSTLDRHNIAYTQHHLKFPSNITKCLDDTSEDGSLLLDFFVHIVKFKETATHAQYKEVQEYMLNSDCSVKDGDEVLLLDSWDVLIVNKPE